MPEHIVVAPNWELVPTGGRIPAYMRKGRTNNNALQVSTLSTHEGQTLELDLAETVAKWTQALGGRVISTVEGDCSFGKYAKAEFEKAGFSHCEVWQLSDGQSVLSVTYICDAPPTVPELEEVRNMALSAYRFAGASEIVQPRSPWWKFW